MYEVPQGFVSHVVAGGFIGRALRNLIFFAMNDRFIRPLADLVYGDIVDWVGERAAARGFDCGDCVGEIFALDDGYAARVTGTNTYVTNLYSDSCGEFCSVCACPVHINCKHAAALAFVVAEILKAGREIPSVTDAVLCLDRATIRKALRDERVRRSQPELVAARDGEFLGGEGRNADGQATPSSLVMDL